MGDLLKEQANGGTQEHAASTGKPGRIKDASNKGGQDGNSLGSRENRLLEAIKAIGGRGTNKSTVAELTDNQLKGYKTQRTLIEADPSTVLDLVSREKVKVDERIIVLALSMQGSLIADIIQKGVDITHEMAEAAVRNTPEVILSVPQFTDLWKIAVDLASPESRPELVKQFSKSEHEPLRAINNVYPDLIGYVQSGTQDLTLWTNGFRSGNVELHPRKPEGNVVYFSGEQLVITEIGVSLKVFDGVDTSDSALFGVNAERLFVKRLDEKGTVKRIADEIRGLLDAAIKRVEERNETIRGNIEEYKKVKQRLEGKVATYQERLRALVEGEEEQEKTRINDLIKEATEDIAGFMNGIARIDGEIEKVKNEIAQIDRQIDAETEQVSGTQEKIAEIRKRLNEVEKRLTKTKNTEEIERLEALRNLCLAELGDAEEKAKATERIRVAEIKKLGLESNNMEMDAKKEKLKVHIEKTQAAIAELEIELNQLPAEIQNEMTVEIEKGTAELLKLREQAYEAGRELREKFYGFARKISEEVLGQFVSSIDDAIGRKSEDK